MKLIRLIMMVIISAVSVVVVHGSVNMKMLCRNNDVELILSDEIRNIEMTEKEVEKIYLTDTANSGVLYISGLNNNVLKNMVYKKMYSALSDKNDNMPYLFRVFADKEEYDSLYGLYKNIYSSAKCFPVPADSGGVVNTPYENSWSAPREYGGDRKHEGTDVMAGNNVSGYFPIVSMSDGVVEKKGWLELGGYRIGIRSPEGIYFYYAHLAEYAEGIDKGEEVKAGQIIGTMGDTGYGKEEGTKGKFDVHLHMGIYINDISYNPYYILRSVERFRKEFVDNGS